MSAKTSERVKPEIIPPNGGWKSCTWYLVDVSYRKGNPIHRSLFYSGFVSLVWFGCAKPTHRMDVLRSRSYKRRRSRAVPLGILYLVPRVDRLLDC